MSKIERYRKMALATEALGLIKGADPTEQSIHYSEHDNSSERVECSGQACTEKERTHVVTGVGEYAIQATGSLHFYSSILLPGKVM